MYVYIHLFIYLFTPILSHIVTLNVPKIVQVK